MNHRKVSSSENPTNISILEKKPRDSMSAGKLSTDCDRVICSPLKIQTLPSSQAVELYGPDMARALDVFQEAYTVRICAKSNTVENHDHQRSLLLMCGHCSYHYNFCLSTNMLFVRFDASWCGIMTSVCVAVLHTYVAIPLAGGTFEHELLSMDCCGPDYRFGPCLFGIWNAYMRMWLFALLSIAVNWCLLLRQYFSCEVPDGQL